jgi:RNA 2',3'-cyclic 3'-phosphodiesterase
MQPQRLFIALEFPPDLIQALDKVLLSFKQQRLQAVRWVSSKNIHLTLRFLGDTYPDGLELVRKMLAEECTRVSSFEVAIEGCGAFPNLRRPRVIWVGIQAPVEMLQLQGAIEKGCQAAGFNGEDRPFNPHLTLGRVSENASREDLAGITRAIQDSRVEIAGRYVLQAVTVVRSDLTPGGPIYTPMGRYLLKSH